jgi:hypothetical protein
MAIKDAPTVKILPFDEKEAYDHDRPISSLIRTQLLHLHIAENLVVPPKAQTNVNINDLHTEREASAYIQKATALLHRYGKVKTGGKTKPRKSSAGKPGKPSGKKAGGRKPTSKSQKTKPAAKKRRQRK